jgi:hypothetical protein
MQNTTYRKATRSTVWPDMKATIKVLDTYKPKRCFSIVQGRVKDLGSMGMFLITPETVPVPAKAEITIDFDPSSTSINPIIKAWGKTVHTTKEGVGISFTVIDLYKLQECIITKINKLNGS